MTATATPHILIDADGTAWIDDSNVKVIEVALDKLAHGSSPEEMHLQYPHLSLAQIYAALAYYHDHQAELDAEIAQSRAEVASLRSKLPETQGRAKLRAAGRLP
jgi:uncharacterized protein (DUF433 family)